jgi:thymidylate kinase
MIFITLYLNAEELASRMSTVIEFLGMSRSGKTTQVQLLASVLKDAGYSCTVVGSLTKSFQESETLEQWHILMYEYLCAAQEAHFRDSTDYLIYDRGFYDRLALLIADYAGGHVSETFRDELAGAIIPRLNHVDFAFVFLLSPELSLARWSRQRAEGLDRSSLDSGLDTRDNLEGLKYMAQVYRVLRTECVGPKWYEIDGSIPVEETHVTIMNILGIGLPEGSP